MPLAADVAPAALPKSVWTEPIALLAVWHVLKRLS